MPFHPEYRVQPLKARRMVLLK